MAEAGWVTMSHVILAVGGTGQVLLHYYCQMFVLGVVEAPFRAIVVDTDRFSRSLQTFQAFFDALREAGCPDPMPEIRTAWIDELPATGVRIHEVMGAPDLPEHGYHHSLQAFYGRNLLALQATDGLYSRPAAASLVVPGIPQLLRDTDITAGNSVLLVTSTIGGTGAGLSLQLLCRAQQLSRQHVDVPVRAVLLGEYFKPDQDKVSNAPLRFRSNKTWFLKSVEHAVPSLLRYAWIDPDNEEDKLPARDTHAELNEAHLPWSAESHPLWQALKAIIFLLTDRSMDAKTFGEGEVGPDQYASRLRRAMVDQRLRESLGRAAALVEHDVLARMAIEAWPEQVWGERLCRAVRSFAHALRRGTMGVERESRPFLVAVQREIRNWWEASQGEHLSIAGLFPRTAPKPASVEVFRRIGWWGPAVDWAGKRFTSVDSAAQVTAAALLHAALQKGGRL